MLSILCVITRIEICVGVLDFRLQVYIFKG